MATNSINYEMPKKSTTVTDTLFFFQLKGNRYRYTS